MSQTICIALVAMMVFGIITQGDGAHVRPLSTMFVFINNNKVLL
jgi:hypothetical protein